MTAPTVGDDGYIAPADYRNACCADPVVGGCPHPVDNHGDGTGACDVLGCPCLAVHRHTAQCIHMVAAAQQSDDGTP